MDKKTPRTETRNNDEEKLMKDLIVDYIPFEVTPEQINESISQNGGKLVVHGVLQRANAKIKMVVCTLVKY